VSAAVVKQGQRLMADTDRCGSCHPYGDNETELGYAPDLNGWGSREWLVGIITDPTHQRFYPETNDRMPSFGVGQDGGVPTLSSTQIGLIADWLRGTWYRPERHEASGHAAASHAAGDAVAGAP
jgi:ubiquinol-cytochrome c reductase cytochrome b subunit